MTKVLIADDHQMFLDGLKALLADSDQVQIVAQALNGEEVLDSLKETELDLAVLDINMPKLDGIATTIRIKEEFPNIKVLILSMYNTPEFITHVLEAGADGYILKNTGKRELEFAISKIMEGKTFYGEAITQTMMESYRKPVKEEPQRVPLTRREKDILREIINELTTAEIAEKLFISTHTVESHRKNMLAKIGARNTAGLVKYAIESGILDGE